MDAKKLACRRFVLVSANVAPIPDDHLPLASCPLATHVKTPQNSAPGGRVENLVLTLV
jgi:hypothetical protein